MRVHGVDFTSAPSRRKPICVAVCRLEGAALRFERLERITTLAAFDASLRAPGPWIAGFDFPFTQSRVFLRNMGWPEGWADFADLLASMEKAEFRERLEAYKADRAPGDREHSRGFERGTGAVSPQKLYGVPVALMQFEGVRRLRAAGVDVPGLCAGDPARIAVEAYPGVVARALIGPVPYKNDQVRKQTAAQADARRLILARLTGTEGRDRFGLEVEAPAHVAEDRSGDSLDALICAVQAAWALRRMSDGLAGLDLSEGWMADPAVLDRMKRSARAEASQ